MNTVAFFDTKPYDKKWFDALCGKYKIELRYIEPRLSAETAQLARGCRAVCAFVSDTIDAAAVEALTKVGVRAVALRSAGFSNVDTDAARGKLKIYRVPEYSPSSVAEHAAALLLTLCRKTHKAYIRTKENNFSLTGLVGVNLKGKTAGIIGTGKIGRSFCEICRGFGMKIVAYDTAPSASGVEYTSLDELLSRSDIVSLHCPLTRDTHHILDREALFAMKPGAYIINTSRGALIDSIALLEAIKSGHLGGAALDVYEEETELFYEDASDRLMWDETLTGLLAQPNVLVTSHQGFLTDEALRAIADTTLHNLRSFFDGQPTYNEVDTIATARI